MQNDSGCGVRGGALDALEKAQSAISAVLSTAAQRCHEAASTTQQETRGGVDASQEPARLTPQTSLIDARLRPTAFNGKANTRCCARRGIDTNRGRWFPGRLRSVEASWLHREPTSLTRSAGSFPEVLNFSFEGEIGDRLAQVDRDVDRCEKAT